MTPKDNSGSSMPPRLCIAFTGQLDDFYAPNYGAKVVRWDHCDIWGKHEYHEYRSEKEVQALLAAARAEVWKEAANFIADFFPKPHTDQQIYDAIMEKAKQAREEAE